MLAAADKGDPSQPSHDSGEQSVLSLNLCDFNHRNATNQYLCISFLIQTISKFVKDTSMYS